VALRREHGPVVARYHHGRDFWTSLWGPVGLLLSTPLTVCLVVIGRYVPRLEFLGTLLSSEPALTPEERFYQRLLGGNVEEAVEIAEGYVDEHGAPAFFDAIAIPALRQAENDRRRNASDTNYRRIVADGALAVLREVEDHVRETAEARAAVGTGAEPASEALENGPASDSGERSTEAHAVARPASSCRVLCIAGRTELDRVGAAMLAQILRDRAPNLAVEVLPPSAVAQDALGHMDLAGVDTVFLSYFHPDPQVYARYVARRLKRRVPALNVVVCAWNAPALTSDRGSASSVQALSADAVVPTIAAAAAHLTGG
jgi:hypothetical protein